MPNRLRNQANDGPEVVSAPVVEVGDENLGASDTLDDDLELTEDVLVRLRAKARYGCVVVSGVEVSHGVPVHIPRYEFDRLAEEYDLELAE